MFKLLTIATLLSACTLFERDVPPNKAEIIVHSQAPEAVCDTATTAKRKISLVVCATPKQDVVALYSPEFPFQVFAIKSTAKIKEEEAAKEAVKAVPPAPAVGSAATPAPAAKK